MNCLIIVGPSITGRREVEFVSELVQIASLRFIEALEGSKITIMIISDAECFVCYKYQSKKL